MPIASPHAAVVAGVLGGSGSHVIQITIVIAVAIVLTGYFVLSRVRGQGGGGDIRAAAATDRAREGATSDGTLRLVRTWGGIGMSGQWDIAIDGIVVGSIANKETVEIDVTPGRHALRLESGRHRSAERSFDVEENEVVGFTCHGPKIWPLLVAAVINPDLWMSLRRE